jgi:branched-chain amino acid transport system permease protein
MNKIKFKSKKFLISVLGLLIVFVLLAALPVYKPGYSITFMSSVLMYVILTVSFVLFFGSTGYLSLGVAAFFGMGVYICAMFGELLPFPVIVFIGGLLSFILAALIGALTLRLKGTYFTMFTFGLVELIKNLFLYIELSITGTRGRMVIAMDQVIVYEYMVGIFILLLLTSFAINRSRYGLALKSIGQNEEAAAHIGINVTMLKVLLFSISAFFMGAAGAVMATKWTYIDPGIAFSYGYSFSAVAMAIFGGVGQLFGPILGSALFTYIEEILVTRIPELYNIIFGLIIIIALMYMPNGLVGLIQKAVKNWRKEHLGEKHAHS